MLPPWVVVLVVVTWGCSFSYALIVARKFRDSAFVGSRPRSDCAAVVNKECASLNVESWTLLVVDVVVLGGADSRCFISLAITSRSEEHTSELQSHLNLVCRL